MSYWDTRLDEEQQIAYLRETVVRRKNFLEQQRATLGMLNVSPHIQIEIEHLEADRCEHRRNRRTVSAYTI